MMVDARQLPAGEIIDCDVCIVGSGAAGITLAHELKDSGISVILLAGGGRRIQKEAQDLYRGFVTSSSNHGPLDQYRQRRLGGTMHVWGGRCGAFDSIDFESRSHVPLSGWPVTKKDLDPFYERAHAYCELGDYTYEASESLPRQHVSMIPGLESPDVSQDTVWRFSPPTNFAKVFLPPLNRSSGIKIFSHAHCLSIELNQEGTMVNHLVVSSLSRNTFQVRARYVILAAGGLEVTRLLLASRKVHSTGIGNGHDLVGRFYMSHMTGDYGTLYLQPKRGPIIWDYERTSDGVYCRRRLLIRADAQRRHGTLNFSAILNYPSIADPAHCNGILSALYLVKWFIAHRVPPEYSRELAQGRGPYSHVLRHLVNVASDPVNLLRFTGKWTTKRMIAYQKLPSVVLPSKTNTFSLHFDAEQSPNRESRVTLSQARDSLGLPRLQVDWRYSSQDVDSLVKSYALIAKSIATSRMGKLDFDAREFPDHIRMNCGVGSHHVGTTRMATTPTAGIVDLNCKLFGVHNLFISSSSVFPTSGYANPTLTIVALAVRLSDHIKSLNGRA